MYPDEKARQRQFVLWYNQYLAPPGMETPSKSSAAADKTGENDGAVTFEAGGRQYTLVVFEVSTHPSQPCQVLCRARLPHSGRMPMLIVSLVLLVHR